MKYLDYTILFLLIIVCIWTDPAAAIPSAGDYTFSSTYVNGTFTSTGTVVSSWSFSDLWADPSVTTTWSGPAPLLPAGSGVNENDLVFFDLLAQPFPAPLELVISAGMRGPSRLSARFASKLVR